MISNSYFDLKKLQSNEMVCVTDNTKDFHRFQGIRIFRFLRPVGSKPAELERWYRGTRDGFFIAAALNNLGPESKDLRNI